jgi:hypothetical protein
MVEKWSEHRGGARIGMHVKIAQFGDVHLQCVAKVSGILGVADNLLQSPLHIAIKTDLTRTYVKFI